MDLSCDTSSSRIPSSYMGILELKPTELRRSNHMKQFWMLRRYLKQNQVNKDRPGKLPIEAVGWQVSLIWWYSIN